MTGTCVQSRAGVNGLGNPAPLLGSDASWPSPGSTSAPATSVKPCAGYASRWRASGSAPSGVTPTTPSARDSSARRRPPSRTCTSTPTGRSCRCGARATAGRAVGWEEAYDEVARRIAEVQARHGPDSVAIYLGNPNVHSLGAMTHGLPLIRALRTHNRYSATSVDQLPHHLAATTMFGHMLILPVPDIDRTAILPRARRQPPRLQRQHDDRAGDAAPAQGAEGPRGPAGGRGSAAHRDRRARRHAPLHPPGHRRPPPRRAGSHGARGEARASGRLAELIEGLDQVRAAVAPFAPERVAAPTGISADRIRALARDFARRRVRGGLRTGGRSPPRPTAAWPSGSSRCSTSSPATWTVRAARSSPARR